MIPGRIEVQRLPGEVIFELPGRELPILRICGVWLLIVSLVPMALAIGWGGDLLRELWETLSENPQDIGLSELVTFLFLIPSVLFMVMALRVMLTGWTFWSHRCRTTIRIHQGLMTIREQLGGWNPCFKLPVREISKLCMLPLASSSETPLPGWFPQDLWFLSLEGTFKRKRLRCAWGYSHLLLQDLGRQLVQEIPGVQKLEVTIEDGTASERTAEPQETPLSQTAPEGSRVTMEAVPGGVGFVIPSLGLMRGSHGLFLMGCFFLLISGGIGVGFFIQRTGGLIDLFPAILISIFILCGIGMVGAGLSMGTRRVRFAAGTGGLRVRSSSIFGMKEQEWAAGDLKQIRVVPTGTTIGDHAVTAIVVETKSGASTRWAKTLKRDEQEWIVAHLKARLGF